MSAINLGGLAVTSKKKGGAKQEKPFLPDPTGKLTPLVAASIANAQAIAAHESTLTQAKATLASAAFEHACRLYAGRETGIEDTFQIGTASEKALVTLQNRYKLPEDQTQVRAILGEHGATILRSSFVIKVDSDAMPAFVQQSFIDELVKLARSLDAMLGTPEGQDGPVFQAISVQPLTVVDKGFHERRYAILSPTMNAQLHKFMPCVIATKLEY